MADDPSATPKESVSSSPPSKEALFRFHIVSMLLALIATGMRLRQAIGRLCGLEPLDLCGQRRYLTTRTLYRWHRAWQSNGIAGLEPLARPHVERSVVLPSNLLDFCERERRTDPDASVPQLLLRARANGVIAGDLDVERSTVWRALRRMDVPTSRRTRLVQRDMRRFAYPNRMLMVLADGKHFRAGLARLRRVALFFLDDATRFALGVIVGTAESSALFLRGLFDVLIDHGMFNACYLDHGTGFTADDTQAVCGLLQIPLIYGEVAYPQGRGKIERFNRTMLAQVLRSYDSHPEIDPDPAHLTLRLRQALNTYNDLPHESLGGSSPREYWNSDPRPLRPIADRQWLRQQFRLLIRPRVSADNIVRCDGVAYEMPLGHAGQYVDLDRVLLEPGAVELRQGARLIRLHPVDPHTNAYERRNRRRSHDATTAAPTPIATAADHLFSHSFAPIVDDDGGFPERRVPNDFQKDDDSDPNT